MLLLPSNRRVKTIIAALFTAAAAIGFAGTPASQAATLTIVGGQLTGATDVDLGSLGIYNVEFFNDTCQNLFAPCTNTNNFDFTSEADALVAGAALLDQVFIDVPEGQFDSEPELTSGITSTEQAIIFIPFSTLGGAFYSALFTKNNENEIFDNAALQGLRPINVIEIDNRALAKFTLVSVVPLPAALPLFGTGLAVMGFMGWRRRRQKSIAAS